MVLPPLESDMFDPACPSRSIPFQVGDKWTAMIVLCLEHGARRFSELRGPLPAVTPKVLTETLRAMERDGVVKRSVRAVNPPHVEYELTEVGRRLLALIEVAREWSRGN